MAGNACLLALQQCHSHHTRNLKDNVSDDATIDTSIHHLASRIAQEAEEQLPKEVYDAFLRFLKNAVSVHDGEGMFLQDKLAQRYETFAKEEIALSGEAHDGLAMYSGPPNADLGLILHIQSEDGNIGETWDTRSATIQLLGTKGVEPARVFCYDWHWRAESTFHGRKHCPMNLRPKPLKDLHDGLSTDILGLLPLPFLVTASSCVRDTYRKRLSGSLVSFDIELVSGSGVLKFDLEYTHKTVNRMILHIHHPTAAFFAGKLRKSAFGLQIDMGLSFMLWLTGQSSSIDCFRREYASSRPPRARSAPLRQLWKYRALESAQERNLKICELDLPFLGWVTRYIQQDLTAVSGDGARSVIDIVVEKITRKIRVTQCENINRKRTKGHNDVVPVGKSKRTAGKRTMRQTKGKAQVVDTDNFRPHQIPPCSSEHTTLIGELQVNSLACMPVPGFASPQHSEQAWVQISNDDDESVEQTCSDADPDLEKTNSPVRNLPKNDCVTHDVSINTSKTMSSDQSCLSDASIPMPFDDQLETETSSQSAKKPKNVTNSGLDLRSMAGEQVDILLGSGRVKLPDNGLGLEFRMEVKKAQGLAAYQKPIKLWFTKDAIELRIDNEIVYDKSFERLLATPRGLEWLCQISHELKLLGNGLEANVPPDSSKSASLKVGPSLPRNPGTSWKAAELRRRLLQGDKFHTAKFTNGTELGRVFFRDVQLLIPEEADFNTVFVKCDLIPEGSRHPNACCRNAQGNDPAVRLGIQVRFENTAVGGSSTIWAELRGKNDLKKVNSLVDFLEDKGDDWTESQPRRFLPRNITRGRDKVSYT